jgi:hypothetical protein
MSRKKNRKTFSAAKAVKALAREKIGAPRPAQVVPGRKTKAGEKHKPTLERLLRDES